MASDFAIAQFQFLERLLVVHGHWCYKRIAQMVITELIYTFSLMLSGRQLSHIVEVKSLWHVDVHARCECNQ